MLPLTSATLFLFSFAPVFAAAADSVSPVAILAPNASQKPWIVTSLSTGSPSGRPGSQPWCGIQFTIREPNALIAGPSPYSDQVTIGPQNATCSARWYWYDDAEPWDMPFRCGEERDETSGGRGGGRWTWWMRKPAGVKDVSGTTNFDLEVKLENKVLVLVGGNDNRTVEQTWVGRGHFEVNRQEGQGQMTGVCGGSGVCSWALKSGTTGQIAQKLTFFRNGTDVIVGG